MSYLEAWRIDEQKMALHNTRARSFMKGALCWIFLGGELSVALLNLCVRLLP
tara:strand:+ start:2702 stop:2857 length:156 start_codon:yes stop_codon:yes gene_type:complete